MLVLALDTALAAVQVAIHDAGHDRVVASCSHPMATGHAEALLPLVEECLRQAGLGYGNVTRIGVTIGPGSFTGVRIALSAARAMALALTVPVLGVTTLAALAEPHLGGTDPILAAIDARRGEIYALLLSPAGEPLLPPCLIAPEALASLLPEGPILALGSGAALVKAVHPAILTGSDPDLPTIAAIARLAAQGTPAALPPTPLYLRAPDAKPQAASLLGKS